jgi:hypothetical protein
MTTTLSAADAARLNRSSVRPVRPNLDGGRPTDPLTLAFEGCIEGLVACRDDRKALLTARGVLVRIRGMELRLLNQIERRIDRLAAKIEPEIQRIAVETDRALCARTEAAR